MRNEKVMVRLLWSIRVFLILNFLFGIWLIFNIEYWRIYFLVNAVFVLGYIWYTQVRLFVGEVKNVQYPELDNATYSVVVPVKDEEEGLFIDSMKSILEQDNTYKRELIIIDDGSSKSLK